MCSPFALSEARAASEVETPDALRLHACGVTLRANGIQADLPQPARSINHCASNGTGRPVAEPLRPSSQALPAISRCAQRKPSVKRARKQPAVIAPAYLPPILATSA